MSGFVFNNHNNTRIVVVERIKCEPGLAEVEMKKLTF